ncbi:MAG: AAA family ATPase [Lachnospiraceae bacterium]|nr:AAA family ATPase [Lachnospiraceae bacterium]
MRLISAYIAGFGRITDRNITFEPGLNEIMDENGKGKTTLAVFIKSMFYGLEYSPRKSSLTERDHYRPWNAGTFGGNLVILVGKKKYRIERTFGGTAKEDTFALFDEDTGEASTDYSEKIGEELFEVDRESFEKSIFVPQGALETKITSQLNAKMGGLGSVQDDMNRYDQAVEAIDNARKVYTATSKVNPGLIKQINEKIREEKEKADRIPKLQEAYDTKAHMLLEKRAQLRQLEYRKSTLSDQLAAIARSEKSVGVYQAKKDSLKKQEDVLQGLDDFFANGLPDEKDIDDLENRERELSLNRNRRDILREKLPEKDEQEFLENLFADRSISEDDIDEWKKESETIRSLRIKGEHVQMSDDERNQLSELREFFKKGTPDDEQIQNTLSDISRCNEISGQMKSLGETHQKHREAANGIRETQSIQEGVSGIVILGFITAVFFMASLFFFNAGERGSLRMILFIGSFVAGVVSAVVFIMQIIHRAAMQKQSKSTMEDELVESEKDLSKLRSEYQKLHDRAHAFIEKYPVSADDMQQALLEIHRKKDRFETLNAEEAKLSENTSGMVEELSELQLKLYTSLDPYAKAFGINLYEDAKEDDLIKKISDKLDDYLEFEENNQEYQRLVATINSETQGILAVLRAYPLKTDITDLAGCLREIRQNMLLYGSTQKQIDELQDELKSLHVDDLAKSGKSLQELQEEQKKLDDDISKQKQFIAEDVKELDSRSATLVEYEEARETLRDLNAKKASYEEKVDLYEETKKYLRIARENFLKVYMGPLRERLNYYMKSLYPDSDDAILTDDFELDMNLAVSVSGKSGGGRTRSSDYLSKGYQDLASFCSRAALIDVLFRREEPMIILDDPFVNFDEEKLTDAKKLMQELSQKYQIIYMTCHESRSLR